jgi:hypothetical protein
MRDSQEKNESKIVIYTCIENETLRDDETRILKWNRGQKKGIITVMSQVTRWPIDD